MAAIRFRWFGRLILFVSAQSGLWVFARLTRYGVWVSLRSQNRRGPIMCYRCEGSTGPLSLPRIGPNKHPMTRQLVSLSPRAINDQVDVLRKYTSAFDNPSVVSGKIVAQSLDRIYVSDYSFVAHTLPLAKFISVLGPIAVLPSFLRPFKYNTLGDRFPHDAIHVACVVSVADKLSLSLICVWGPTVSTRILATPLLSPSPPSVSCTPQLNTPSLRDGAGVLSVCYICTEYGTPSYGMRPSLLVCVPASSIRVVTAFITSVGRRNTYRVMVN